MAVLCIHGLILLLIVDIFKTRRLKDFQPASAIGTRLACAKLSVFDQLTDCARGFPQETGRITKIEQNVIHSEISHGYLVQSILNIAQAAIKNAIAMRIWGRVITFYFGVSWKSFLPQRPPLAFYPEIMGNRDTQVFQHLQALSKPVPRGMPSLQILQSPFCFSCLLLSTTPQPLTHAIQP